MITEGGRKPVGRPSGPNLPPLSSDAAGSTSDIQFPSTCTDEANHRPPSPLPSPQAGRVDLRRGRATPQISTRCSVVSSITSQIPLLRRQLPLLFNTYRDRVGDRSAIAPISFPGPPFGQIQIAAYSRSALSVLLPQIWIDIPPRGDRLFTISTALTLG
jgi:hypothetical protein